MDQRREPEGPQLTPTQPSMPESKPTTKLAPVPEWAVEMTKSMKEGFRQTNANIDLVSTDLSIVKDRVAIIESWKNDSETRMTRTSGRVQQASQVDLEQAAQLAQERAARESLAIEVAAIKAETSTQTLLLAQLLKLTEKPVVKLVLTAVGSAVLSWLAAKGIHQ